MHRMLAIAATAPLWLSLCGAVAPGTLGARSAIQRDMEGYAIAACLFGQSEPRLKEQGDGWASVIVQRGTADLDDLSVIAKAVKTELAKGDMVVVRSEAGPAPDKALPILYCGEIIDRPVVRAAIVRIETRLKASPRRR